MQDLHSLRVFMDQQEINSAAKGFLPPADSLPELERHLLLTVGELVEAHDELRAGHAPDEVYTKDGKPEGFGVELADAFIRICHIAKSLETKYPGFDFIKMVKEKFAYNATRPFKHGKAF